MSLRTWFRDWLNAPSAEEVEQKRLLRQQIDANFEQELARTRSGELYGTEKILFGTPQDKTDTAPGRCPPVVGGFVGDRVIEPGQLARLLEAATSKGDSLTHSEVLSILEPECGDDRDS